MNLVIPPLFFYVIGAMLVIFGGARALWLGVRRPNRELSVEPADIADADAEAAADAAQAISTAAATAAKARRRHLTFGIVWILMGLFLIISTAGVLKGRLPG
jgi:hypothetical protein